VSKVRDRLVEIVDTLGVGDGYPDGVSGMLEQSAARRLRQFAEKSVALDGLLRSDGTSAGASEAVASIRDCHAGACRDVDYERHPRDHGQMLSGLPLCQAESASGRPNAKRPPA
jgi:hypothetical protein